MTALTLNPSAVPRAHERTRATPEKPPSGLTGGWTAVTIVIGIMAALIALGGMVLSFRAVSVEMVPAFGQRWAWLVPIVVDLTVFVFSGVDLVLARLDMGHPLARWTVYGATGGTVYLNYNAAGDAVGHVAHVLMPSIWVVFIELMRHVVRRQVGLVTGSRRQPIPVARWLMSPVPTFLLFRRMVLWRENSYPAALDMERRRLGALAVVDEYTGRATPGAVSPLLRRQIVWGELDADQVRAALTATRVETVHTPVSVEPNDPGSVDLPYIPQVRVARVSDAQYQALAWVARNTVILDDDGTFAPVPGVPIVDMVPESLTLRSVVRRGWVARTPGRPAGLTVIGVGVLGSRTGVTDSVVHYRSVTELTRGTVVELAAAQGGLRSGWVSDVSRLGPAEMVVHVNVLGGVEAPVFPDEYVLRVVGFVDADRRPVLWTP